MRACHYYVLDGNHNVVATDDVLEWARFFESDARIVAQHEGEAWALSTVFIGLPEPMALLTGEPLGVFETGLFVNGRMVEDWRHDTWDEASAFHFAKFVELADRELSDARNSGA